MRTGRRAGALVIIGGAEAKQGECAILRQFVRLAGGSKARLVVMTVASTQPQEVGAEYRAVFEHCGVHDVDILDLTRRDHANEASALDVLGKATGVFFTGGEQLRISALLGGTKMDQLLHRKHETGMVLGGTSAGASMMSSTMIIQGKALVSPRTGIVELGPGLEFVPGMIIDQHFAQRGRTGRLLSAVAQHPHQLGIGIDENTALIVQDDEFEVIGEGSVTVLDAGAVTYDDVLEAGDHQPLAMFGVMLHVLPAGFRFNLVNRTPIVQAKSTGKRNHRSSHEDSVDPGAAGSKHIRRASGPASPDPPRRTHRNGEL